MSIKNAIFKLFNGSAWDEYHFQTNSEQVKHTTESGSETTVKNALDELNSNLNKFTQRIGSIAFSAGSAVRTPNGTSVSMLSLADLNSRFGVTDCSNFNTAVFFANGDSGANGAHIEGATYQNGAWYAVFDRSVTTNIRINFLAVRWNLS